MEATELKQWIRQAREVVQDEPEPYKLEAFKVILSRLMEEHASISEIVPEEAIRKKTAKKVTGKIPDHVL